MNARKQAKRQYRRLWITRLNAAGTTIVQVTHNEAWAEYGRRVIELKDGWIDADRAVNGAAR